MGRAATEKRLAELRGMSAFRLADGTIRTTEIRRLKRALRLMPPTPPKAKAGPKPKPKSSK